MIQESDSSIPESGSFEAASVPWHRELRFPDSLAFPNHRRASGVELRRRAAHERSPCEVRGPAVVAATPATRGSGWRSSSAGRHCLPGEERDALSSSRSGAASPRFPHPLPALLPMAMAAGRHPHRDQGWTRGGRYFVCRPGYRPPEMPGSRPICNLRLRLKAGETDWEAGRCAPWPGTAAC
jgi:hypothetical protein